ncbi:hypothetical protein BDV06DRAFT_62512 [Aspergillus oleicola]
MRWQSRKRNERAIPCRRTFGKKDSDRDRAQILQPCSEEILFRTLKKKNNRPRRDSNAQSPLS